MSSDLTHASFFSGAGGLDLGLERAGWRPVSFSEIDPYASAVLAQRWPGVPNLGDITKLAEPVGQQGRSCDDAALRDDDAGHDPPATWHGADLWSGGFPCQDLSVAGKRRGMGAGTRSGLAFSFLELVGRHRPRFVLLENVPGLISSHAGRDFGSLLGAMVELGYGVAWRELDARYFGVPQRRRRVFILGDSLGGRAGAERAAEVLSVGSRCRRHPPTGVEAGEGAAERTKPGVDVVGSIDANHGRKWGSNQWVDPGKGFLRITRPRWRRVKCDHCDDWACSEHGGHIGERCNCWSCDDCGNLWRPDELNGHGLCPECSPADSRRVREADGLARGPHDRPGVDHARPLLTNGKGGQRTTDLNIPLTVAFAQNQRGELRTSEQAFQLTTGDGKPGEGYSAVLGVGASGMTTDPLLPLGLDSHRYRCCGNGVVADVGEWIGRRLAEIA